MRQVFEELLGSVGSKARVRRYITLHSLLNGTVIFISILFVTLLILIVVMMFHAAITIFGSYL